MTRRSKLPTVQELASHARQIANAFDVVLMEVPEDIFRPEDAVAFHVTAKMIDDLLARTTEPDVQRLFHQLKRDILRGKQCSIVFVKPITDETLYAVAMHELGHCIAPNGNIQGPDRPRLKVLMETVAWEWAEHHALDWTIAMQHVKAFALGTYVEGQRREERAKVLDEQQKEIRADAVKRFLKKVFK